MSSHTHFMSRCCWKPERCCFQVVSNHPPSFEALCPNMSSFLQKWHMWINLWTNLCGLNCVTAGNVPLFWLITNFTVLRYPLWACNMSSEMDYESTPFVTSLVTSAFPLMFFSFVWSVRSCFSFSSTRIFRDCSSLVRTIFVVQVLYFSRPLQNIFCTESRMPDVPHLHQSLHLSPSFSTASTIDVRLRYIPSVLSVNYVGEELFDGSREHGPQNATSFVPLSDSSSPSDSSSLQVVANDFPWFLRMFTHSAWIWQKPSH